MNATETRLETQRHANRRKEAIACHIAILAAAALFLSLAARHIESPGVYYDEAWQAPCAIFLMKDQVNSNYAEAWGVTIAGRRLPVMNGEYTGAVKSYIMALGFYLFGVKVSVMRLTMAFVALIGILYAAYFAREAFGSLGAICGVWLMATDPTIIMCSRNDWGPIAVAFALRASSLYYLARWWKSGGRRRYLIIACALLGLGIFDKTSFLWFVLALVTAGAGVWLTSRSRPRVGLADVGLALASGFVTSAPLWVYNLRYDWITFRMVKLPNQHVTLRSLLDLVPERTGVLKAMFAGRALGGWMFGQETPASFGISETILAPLTLIAAAVLLIAAAAQRRWKLIGLPLLMAIMILEIYSTPRQVWVHHWISVYPFPHLMIGAMCAVFWGAVKSYRVARLAAVALAVVMVPALGRNLAVMASYHHLMRERGGSLSWSQVAPELADVVKTRYADRTIQVMDWGAGNQLVLFSEGRLRVREPVWSPEDLKQPGGRLEKLVADPENVFVIVYDEGNAGRSKSRHSLMLAAERTRQAVDYERRFFDRHGQLYYSLIAFARPNCPKITGASK